HGAIDDVHSTRWDILPRTGRANAAYFALEPVLEGETLLTLVLDCQDPFHHDHILGKFRLSGTANPQTVREENRIARAENDGAWAGLGLADGGRGEWEAARVALEKAVAVGDASPAELLLALAREQSGRPLADEDLDRVLGLVDGEATPRLLMELGLDLLSARI